MKCNPHAEKSMLEALTIIPLNKRCEIHTNIVRRRSEEPIEVRKSIRGSSGEIGSAVV
jgi:hypothetical protein